MARVWPHREQPPPLLWREFCQSWLHLSSHHTGRWWAAVCRSRWSRAVTVRSTIRGYEIVDTQLEQVWHLYHDILAPRALLELIEDLIRERIVARRETCAIADAILRQVDVHGEWKGVAEAGGPTPLVDLNQAIFAVLDRV
jgi:hypothetical protein